jgi:hypothetical protein
LYQGEEIDDMHGLDEEDGRGVLELELAEIAV